MFYFKIYCCFNDNFSMTALRTANQPSLQLVDVFIIQIKQFRRFFFYFLVYRSSDPNFCILEKNENFIFDFFYFLRCKNLPDLKKKKNIKKNNKNCMILHFKNAEISAFLQCKIVQFLLFFFSDPNMIQIKCKKKFLVIFIFIFFPSSDLNILKKNL